MTRYPTINTRILKVSIISDKYLISYICILRQTQMKYILISILLLQISSALYSQEPDFLWANQCGNPPNTSDTKSAIAPGADGSFYMAAEFLDTVAFGEKVLVSAGGTDIYLVKHTAEGIPAWSVKLGGNDYDYVQKLETDEEGNIIMTGYFYGTTQIGPDQYTSFGSQDIFVAKYNSAGTFLWSYRAGGPMAAYITGLATGNDHDIVITGYYYDSITFGDTTIYESGSSDIYLAGFNNDGQLQWLTQAGGSSSDQSRSVSCDPEGNILLNCSYYYDFSIGDTTLTTQNPVGVAIAKFSPSGDLIKVFQLDGTYLTPEVYNIACQDGSFYLSGNFSEQLVFGSKTFDAGEFNQDIFIAKYDSGCDLVWAKHAHSFASDQVVGLVTDQFDNLYLTGHYLDSLYIDNLKLRYTLCCGSREVFILSINPGGDVQWGEQITGTRANVQALSISSQGELLLSGLFSEEIIMGHLSLSNFDTFRNYLTSLDTETLTFIGDPITNTGLTIFPNPAHDQLRFTGDFNGKVKEYRIYNVGGTMVSSGKTGEENSVVTNTLPGGAYILQVHDPLTGTMHYGKFVK